MRVLIMGSLKQDMGVEESRFIEACREIGRKLVERGHDIIISATDRWTADFHVLEGAAAVPGHHLVTVLQGSDHASRSEAEVYRSSGLRPDGTELQELSSLKNITVKTQTVVGRWPSNRIQAISKAEVVILIGGRFGVASVGVSAPLLKTPVVAIGAFGGAAKDVLDEVSVHYGQAGIHADDVRSLRNWGSESADIVCKLAEMLVKRNPYRDNQVSQFVIASSILLLLIAWISIYVIGGRSPGDVALFSLLGVAALIGTGLRTELRLLSDENALLSSRQLTLEATLGIVLAFIFCLLYLTGNFVLTGTFITLTGKTANDFARVATTLSLMGVGAAFLLEPAAEYLRKRLGEIISPAAPGHVAPTTGRASED